MSSKSSATIADVAHKAGVSTATVSRMINGIGPVSDETEERVRSAINELKYTPKRKRRGRSTAAGGDVASRKHPIAFLRIGAFETQDRSPVTEHLIEALHRNAHALGRTLTVHHVPDPSSCKVRDIIGDAEGVLIRTSNIKQVIRESVSWLEGIPAVQVLGGDPIDRHWLDHVSPDNNQAGALAADYLIECGCKKLVFAATNLANGTGKERCMSFLRTAVDAGKEIQAVVHFKPGSEKVLERELLGLSAQYNVVENRMEMIRMIASTNPNPFGLFVPTDLELAMIMPQLQMMGMNLDKGSHFIGCDREGRCLSGLEPMPATLDLHIENLAARSIRRLIQRIKYPNEPLVRIAVSPDLVRPHDVLNTVPDLSVTDTSTVEY